MDANNLPTSDYMVPMLVQRIMPIGIAGVFLTDVMSTVSSLLILASAAIIKDLSPTYVIKGNKEKIAKYEATARHIRSFEPFENTGLLRIAKTGSLLKN